MAPENGCMLNVIWGWVNGLGWVLREQSQWCGPDAALVVVGVYSDNTQWARNGRPPAPSGDRSRRVWPGWRNTPDGVYYVASYTWSEHGEEHQEESGVVWSKAFEDFVYPGIPEGVVHSSDLAPPPEPTGLADGNWRWAAALLGSVVGAGAGFGAVSLVRGPMWGRLSAGALLAAVGGVAGWFAGK